MITRIATYEGNDYWRCRSCHKTWISGGNPEFEHVCHHVEFGPGTEFAKMATGLGFKECGACEDLKRKMNEWGPLKCRDRIESIVDSIASRTRVPFARHAIRTMVELAIERSMTASPK